MTKKELRSYRTLKEEAEQLGRVVFCLPDGFWSREEADKATERYTSKLKESLQLLDAIEDAIESLSATERVLMRAKYIEGLTWEEVADLMHYDVRQIHRIHGRALQRLARDPET